MVIDSASALVAAIRAAGLLDAAQLREVETALCARFPDPVDLARHLMRADWLTPYQVNQLLQGNGDTLRLGPYVLLERLGAGGMGEVFKARHCRLERVRALKLIRKQRLASPNALARFHREVEAAAKLSHPNIVAVYDAGEENDVHYLAMELIEGIDLGKLVQQCGPLPVAQACDYARQAALGLHHAHQHGIIHRDVKPQNLLVTVRAPSQAANGKPSAAAYAGGTVKVLDMGLVHFETGQGEGPLTQLGAVLGTVDYLSPEQAKSSRGVDHRSDLYSLGCTLYHLLAGRPPFAGGGAMDRLLKHQIDDPPPLTRSRPEAPREVSAIVRRLLAKRPEERYASANEVALALAAALPACPAPVPLLKAPAPSNPKVSSPAPTRALEQVSEEGPKERPPDLAGPARPLRRRFAGKWWVAGTSALVVVGLIGLAALALRQPVTQPSARKGGPDQPPGKTAPPRPVPGKAPGLAGYLPADCAGVVEAHVKGLLASEVRRRQGTEIEPNLRATLQLLGMTPRDVEWARLYLPAGKGRSPLVLARGRIGLLQLGGPGRLNPIAPKGDEPLTYRLARPKAKPAFVGVAHPYLLVSEERKSVVAGLLEAERTSPATDHPLRPLLDQVDPQQTLWLAIALDRLGPIRLAKEKPPAQLNALISNARHVHGGVTYSKDLRGKFIFEAPDEKAAERLERALKGARDWLRTAGKAPGLDRDRQMIAELLATAVITRAGTTLTATCHLLAGKP